MYYSPGRGVGHVVRLPWYPVPTTYPRSSRTRQAYPHQIATNTRPINDSPGKVNYAGNLNVLMLGLGGVIWIPPIYFWGRAPVLFWTTFTGTFFTLACVLTPSFTVFYGFRALMGLTHTAGQTIGLAFIKDMFFFHEHARKIGLWVAFFFASPYMGPLLGNFIIDGTGEWRPVFWLVFAIGCLDLLLIVLFLDETWYRRELGQADQPDRGSR